VSFTVIAAIVAVVIILVALGYVMSRRRTQHRDELRGQASQHRDLADVAQIEADRRTAEADELAARARREELASRQARLAAEQTQTEVDGTRTRADELDPDVHAR
jgi:hypothetical protein